ncbi:RNase HII [Lachnospiraceae bacterium]|nr:RNase HII [Lachnospiraceae bacterium]
MAETIKEIREKFQNAEISKLRGLIELYSVDERSGVTALVKSAQKKIDALEKEKARMYEMFSFEREYGDREFICGIDEVGRGPLAGPVMTGAVILPKDCDLLYLNDSKKLSPEKREVLAEEIKKNAVAWAIGRAEPERIDEINILQATYEAMRQAIQNLSVKPDILLNDAVIIPEVQIPQIKIIKGDAKSASIAAASIIAKVARDHVMVDYDKEYPGYDFAGNKGYGSSAHIEALKKLGPCPIHRRSFIGNFVEV